MAKQIIATDKAPAAIGPYSHAVRLGNFLFTSGQIPLDQATGQIVEGGIQAQTRRSLENLKTIVEAAGSSLDRVVKTTVFLKDMKDFAAMNEVYASYFTANAPARSAVEVARLPKDALVEIELVAEID